jgi:hypothetical protein
MLTYADLVGELSTTEGIGTFTLTGPMDGGRSFLAGAGEGAYVSYRASNLSNPNEWEVGTGQVSGATLSRLIVDISSAGGSAKCPFTAGTKAIELVQSSASMAEQPMLCDGRLSLVSGVSVPDDALTSTSNTIYFVPHVGNRINNFFRPCDVFAYLDGAEEVAIEYSVWNSTFVTGTITGASVATPCVLQSVNTLVAGDMIGIRSVGGTTSINNIIFRVQAATGTTITLEGSTGTGTYTSGGTWYKIDNTRISDPLSSIDGALVKTSDPTRKYLGSFLTIPNTNQTVEDSRKTRFLQNFYNPVWRTGVAKESTVASYTYSGAWRPSNAWMGVGVVSVQLFNGVPLSYGRLIKAHNGAQSYCGTQQATAGNGIGVNRATSNDAQMFGGNPTAPAGSYNYGTSRYIGTGFLGVNVITRLEMAGGSNTWEQYAANGSNQAALHVEWLG